MTDRIAELEARIREYLTIRKRNGGFDTLEELTEQFLDLLASAGEREGEPVAKWASWLRKEAHRIGFGEKRSARHLLEQVANAIENNDTRRQIEEELATPPPSIAGQCYECDTPLQGPYCPKCDPRVSPSIAGRLMAAVEMLLTRNPFHPSDSTIQILRAALADAKAAGVSTEQEKGDG
jgi:hypothetical protein